MNFVIARYDHIDGGHCLYTSAGFIAEINHAYSRNFKNLKYAVNFANKKMGRRFYYLIKGETVHSLSYVTENIERGKKIYQDLISK